MKVKKLLVNGHQLYVRPDTQDAYIVKEAAGYRKKIEMDSRDRWLDGGANIGAFAVHCAEAVEFVLCVEPEPKNFLMLKVNTEQLDNVHRMRAAIVGDKSDSVQLYLNNATNMGAHSQFVQRGREHIHVSAANINDLIKVYELNALKLDVEGAEYGILKGIKSSMWRRLNKVIFEFHINLLKDTKRDKLKELLVVMGQEGLKGTVHGESLKEGNKSRHCIVTAIR